MGTGDKDLQLGMPGVEREIEYRAGQRSLSYGNVAVPMHGDH